MSFSDLHSDRREDDPWAPSFLSFCMQPILAMRIHHPGPKSSLPALSSLPTLGSRICWFYPQQNYSSSHAVPRDGTVGKPFAKSSKMAMMLMMTDDVKICPFKENDFFPRTPGATPRRKGPCRGPVPQEGSVSPRCTRAPPEVLGHHHTSSPSEAEPAAQTSC